MTFLTWHIPLNSLNLNASYRVYLFQVFFFCQWVQKHLSQNLLHNKFLLLHFSFFLHSIVSLLPFYLHILGILSDIYFKLFFETSGTITFSFSLMNRQMEYLNLILPKYLNLSDQIHFSRFIFFSLFKSLGRQRTVEYSKLEPKQKASQRPLNWRVTQNFHSVFSSELQFP